MPPTGIVLKRTAKLSSCLRDLMMRLLLDTCIVYDWLMGEIKNQPIIERIQNEGAVVSSVSVWELNNHQLKLVGLNCGLEVRIRVDLTTRLMEVPS